MNLTELLFGKFVPPVTTSGFVHRIGFAGSSPYVPTYRERKQRLPKEKQITESAQKIYKILTQQTKPISAAEMEKKTPWTRNHCNMIMCQLFKEGLATRYKEKGAGTRWYMYSAKIKTVESNDN